MLFCYPEYLLIDPIHLLATTEWRLAYFVIAVTQLKNKPQFRRPWRFRDQKYF